MKNIVTIDFDIIMAPSINLYNNIVGPNKWENEFSQDLLIRLSFADLQHYHNITLWLLNIIKQIPKEKVHFIFDHEQVLNYIPLAEEVNLINIDHHHDIGYGLADQKDITDANLTCGNWIKYLINHGKLVKYHWINNKNSTPLENDIITDEQKKMFITTNLIDFNLNDITDIDELIICLSELWIPPNYRHLFYTWLDICNTSYSTHFELETKK